MRRKLPVIFKRWVLPLSPLALTIVLCLSLKERFPFSDFPMYSRFDDLTFYVYVTDPEGEPVPVQDITYVRTSRLKRIYDTEIGEVRDRAGKRKRDLSVAERRDAGDHTLTWLYETTRPGGKPFLERYGGLRLYHVDISIDGGRVREHEPELVGEITLPPPAGAVP